jgi:alpha-mannosidase
VPAQVLTREGYWGHAFQRIAFPLMVPGLGYTRFLVHERVTTANQRQTAAEPPSPASAPGAARRTGFVNVCTYSSYERSPEGLENEHLSLSLDTQRGGIKRLTHRPSGTVLIQDVPSILEYAIERARPMSAWLIEHEGAVSAPVVTRLETLHTGPHVAAIAVSMRVASSEMKLTYELRAGEPRLHLYLQVTWMERGGPEVGTPVLRLSLPLCFAAPDRQARVFYEIPFGAIERAMAHGEEVPALRWAAVEAGPAAKRVACVLFNDSKYGHSFHNGTLALTLLRSSFSPDPLPEIGQHEVRCAISCEPAPFDAAAASRAAAAFDQELQVVSTTRHPGRLAPTARLLRVEGGVLSGLKAAEDGAGVVVRVYNPSDKTVAARIEVARELGRVTKAEEVDLLERGQEALPVEGAAISLRIGPRGIRSIRVALAP